MWKETLIEKNVSLLVIDEFEGMVKLLLYGHMFYFGVVVYQNRYFFKSLCTTKLWLSHPVMLVKFWRMAFNFTLLLMYFYRLYLYYICYLLFVASFSREVSSGSFIIVSSGIEHSLRLKLKICFSPGTYGVMDCLCKIVNRRKSIKPFI